MFSIFVILTDNCAFEGWILIDRCGKHFGAILNFLRDGSVALPESSRSLSELLAEAKYYCILDLADFCDRALQNKQKEPEPICRVPLITSQKEEQLLISSSVKVHFIFFLKCLNSSNLYNKTACGEVVDQPS